MSRPHRLLALAACLLSSPALAGQGLAVEIVDRTTGQVLPQYRHDGHRYVAGEPGHEYAIRIRNRSPGRVLAVTSVDGVNVISGRTAAPHQGGYVLDGHERLEVDGWRKSLGEVAAFYFTTLPDSYAARTGRPDDVGVIGIALFRERAPASIEEARRSQAAPKAEARAAASPTTESGFIADESRLGTGHGRRLDSGAVYTSFERASDSPDVVIRIDYDSRRNLIAHGIIPRPKDRHAWRHPEPFPGGFVPDP